MTHGSSATNRRSPSSSTARRRRRSPTRHSAPTGPVVSGAGRLGVVAVASAAVDDDAALVARLKHGDEAAFVVLIRRYQPRLLRTAEATVGSRAVAEEACQETWVAVLRG